MVVHAGSKSFLGRYLGTVLIAAMLLAIAGAILSPRYLNADHGMPGGTGDDHPAPGMAAPPPPTPGVESTPPTIPPDYTDACRKIHAALVNFLVQTGTPPDQIVQETDPRRNETCSWLFMHLAAPASQSAGPIEFEERIQAYLNELNARITARIGINGVMPFTVRFRDVPVAEIELQRAEPLDFPEELPLDSMGLDDAQLAVESPDIGQEKKSLPRAAIIVDDGGYGGAATDAFLAMDPKLTLAIMPGGTYAAEIARKAKAAGFEVILHLPMEHELGPEWLNMNMSQETIRERTEDAIARVPGIVGINSHMGSLFTADRPAVERFINVIKDKPYYFIDSRTTARSKILDMARAAGVRAASRDVFLDNKADAAYIRKQFEQLISIAKRRGEAIGICHFREKTARIMPKLLPLLKENGIELVHASELVH